MIDPRLLRSIRASSLAEVGTPKGDHSAGFAHAPVPPSQSKLTAEAPEAAPSHDSPTNPAIRTRRTRWDESDQVPSLVGARAGIIEIPRAREWMGDALRAPTRFSHSVRWTDETCIARHDKVTAPRTLAPERGPKTYNSHTAFGADC